MPGPSSFWRVGAREGTRLTNDTLCFYMDDSGSRHPDRKRQPDEHFGGWFGLGGVVINERDLPSVDAAIDALRAAWPALEEHPLHSYDIRNMQGDFRWLRTAGGARRTAFLNDLTATVVGLPLLALACVVDRDGYNRRYLDAYGPRRWKLCKTAFSIAVERAAKFALHSKARLRVFVEKSDKVTDNRTRQYYESLRVDGMPFNVVTSGPHAPLSADAFNETLFEFRLKDKKSAAMQIADLALWPVCRNGYGDDRSFDALREHGRLIESACDDANGLKGSKYSCFEQVIRANKSPLTRALERPPSSGG